jgi:hypothetical protein
MPYFGAIESSFSISSFVGGKAVVERRAAHPAADRVLPADV